MGYRGKCGYLGASGGVLMGYRGKYVYLGGLYRGLGGIEWGCLEGSMGGVGIDPIGYAIGPGPSRGSAAPCVPPPRGRAPE